MMIYLMWCVCVLLAIYLYIKQRYSYFRKLGVKYIPPVPILGNFGAKTFRSKHLSQVLKEIYDQFPEERFVGLYELFNPLFLIRDLDTMKAICVKDFDSFQDHRFVVDENVDPFFGRSLGIMKGQKWRDMRATLSPAFTSSKMRNMFLFMSECGDQVVHGLKKDLDQTGVSHLDLEVQELCTRYANDVIASTAFGLRVNSIQEKENYFYRMVKKTSNFSGIQTLIIMGYGALPSVMKIFKIKLFSDQFSNYFRNLIISNMKEREEKNIYRSDMIHLLMEAKKGTLKHEMKSKDEDMGFATVEESAVGTNASKIVWEDDDLVAQAVLFLIAGFDTASTAINFFCYELAVNPDVQKKLQAEIDETSRKNNGQFNYTDIQQMQYLDMVVCETLRKWPPAVFLDRICTKSYNIGKPSKSRVSQDVIIQPGQGVWCVLHAIHHDPKYWSNPEQFDPERFSDENKSKIVPLSYIPFGLGPRNCIGSRFALMELKILAYKLYGHYNITAGPKTVIPIQLDPAAFSVTSKGGCWLRFTKRQSKL